MQIEAMRPGDLPALHRIVIHPAAARMLPAFDTSMTLEDREVLLAGETLFLPMRLVAWHNGLVSGSVTPNAGDMPSLSYVVDQALWGRGIATEMVAAVMAEIVACFGPCQLRACAFDDNAASIRVLRRLGFRPVGMQVIAARGRDTPAPASRFRWQRNGKRISLQRCSR